MKPKKKQTERTIQDYAIDGFTLYSKDNLTNNEEGRGIGIYINNSINKLVSQVTIDSEFEEFCLINIKTTNQISMLFGCFYRSPTQNMNYQMNNLNLNNLLKRLSSTNQYKYRCFCGDFNFRDIKWPDCTTTKSEESAEYMFIETIRDCFLQQHVHEPTRSRGTNTPSTIDLIFADNEVEIKNLEYYAPLGKSDHSVLSFEFHTPVDYIHSSTMRFLYEKADYELMREGLKEIDWKSQFESCNVREMWDFFKQVMLNVRDIYVPIQQDRSNAWKTSFAVPLNKDLRCKIKEKSRLHRQWIRKQHGVEKDLLRKRYARMRNQIKGEIRKSKARYENDIAEKSQTSPKVFWSFIRKQLKVKTGVSPLLDDPNDKNSIKYFDSEKANILQKQFTSVFTEEPPGEVPTIGLRTEKIIQPLIISPDAVLKKLLSLDTNKSVGPDNIHPMLLRRLANELKEPLTAILQKSLNEGQLPDDWRNAIISPIHKKGSKVIASNYRPISLTSIVCKILESFVKEAVIKFLTEEKLISSKQYGFMEGRSTTTQLLYFMDKCADVISRGDVVDTVYFDFAKAFDTVPHLRLTEKMRCYGLIGQIGTWIKAFITNRCQTVRVNSDYSSPAHVLSGVPQGSVLGPTLFLMYINDLPENIKSELLLFADDAKLMAPVRCFQDALSLQNDIDELEKWPTKWLVNFHPDKCHILTLGKFQNIKYAHRYVLNVHNLDHVEEEKDLGITFDSEMTFEKHFAEKIKKANQMAGMIRRSFTSLDPKLFKMLFTTFVRPHLEYGQAIWSPHLKKNIKSIENVQRRATKSVNGFKNFSYQERLERLNMPTLAFRRLRNDMIEIYKHFEVYDKETITPTFQPRTRPSRSHNRMLMPPIARDGVRGVQHNSFYYRSVTTWNNLPKDVPIAPSVHSFKRRLDMAWKDNPLKYLEH